MYWKAKVKRYCPLRTEGVIAVGIDSHCLRPQFLIIIHFFKRQFKKKNIFSGLLTTILFSQYPTVHINQRQKWEAFYCTSEKSAPLVVSFSKQSLRRTNRQWILGQSEIAAKQNRFISSLSLPLIGCLSTVLSFFNLL